MEDIILNVHKILHLIGEKNKITIDQPTNVPTHTCAYLHGLIYKCSDLCITGLYLCVCAYIYTLIYTNSKLVQCIERYAMWILPLTERYDAMNLNSATFGQVLGFIVIEDAEDMSR